MAQGGGIFDFLDFLPAADQIYKNLNCSSEVRSVSECNLTPFTGVFVCRQFFGILSYNSEHSVCVRNFAEGATLGFEHDTCGCCGGACPAECPCGCGEPDEDGVQGSVEIQPVLIFDKMLPPICVPRGVARQLVAWGGRVVCNTECTDGSNAQKGDETESDAASDDAV